MEAHILAVRAWMDNAHARLDRGRRGGDLSTQFRPLEIPLGVVAKATKQVRSTNWAEAHLMRWVEAKMVPVGGQSQYNFTFASRCKKVHG